MVVEVVVKFMNNPCCDVMISTLLSNLEDHRVERNKPSELVKTKMWWFFHLEFLRVSSFKINLVCSLCWGQTLIIECLSSMVRVRQWNVTGPRCTCVYVWYGRYRIEHKWLIFPEKLFTYSIICSFNICWFLLSLKFLRYIGGWSSRWYDYSLVYS